MSIRKLTRPQRPSKALSKEGFRARAAIMQHEKDLKRAASMRAFHARAYTIINSETSQAASHIVDAIISEAGANGLITGWVWQAYEDACPICEELSGTVFDASETFEEEHPNCRCEPIPIREEE